MKINMLVPGIIMLRSACTAPASQPDCPRAAALTSSIDQAWFDNLSERLKGPDRENSIAEAVSSLHRNHPTMSSTMIADVVIAADCPAPSHAGISGNDSQARIADLRAEVLQIMNK